MVEEDHDHRLAMQVAQSLVVFFKRPGGQSQFSNLLNAQTQDEGGRFAELHAWIAGNLKRDLGVEALAQRVGMSPRSFARHYKELTGVTPARSIEMIRVDQAKRMLEQAPALPLAKIPLGTSVHNLELQPGMPVEALIKTGARTALGYMLSPLTENIDLAFRER